MTTNKKIARRKLSLLQLAADMGMYEALLKKYKGKKPEKIYDSLDRDPDPLFEK